VASAPATLWTPLTPLAAVIATMREYPSEPLPRIVYNAVGVPVATGLLYPFTGTLINPIWAERRDDIQFSVGDWQALRLAGRNSRRS